MTDVPERRNRLAGMCGEILILLAKNNATFEASGCMPVEAQQAARASNDPKAVK